MTYLSQSQLEMYAAAAGAANPKLAAAVAMAESKGNTGAHNIVPPDDSYGLWQINMLGVLGPDRRAKLGITSNSQLYDPGTNARAMVMVSGGGANFGAWSTYTSGEYAKYYTGTAVQAATGAQPIIDWNDPFGLVPPQYKDQEPTAPGGDLLNSLGSGGSLNDAFSFVGSAASWLSKASNWLRVGYVIGGSALAIVGLAMVIKDQELAAASGSIGKALGGATKKLKKGTT